MSVLTVAKQSLGVPDTEMASPIEDGITETFDVLDLEGTTSDAGPGMFFLMFFFVLFSML